MRRIIVLLLFITITTSFVSCKRDAVPPSTAEAQTKEEANSSESIMMFY